MNKEDYQNLTPDDLIPAPEELGFSWADAQRIVKDYSCSQCNEMLSIKDGGEHNKFIVVCQDHGDIEEIGRVRNSTVSIRYEQAHCETREVKKNLADLFPKEKKSEKQILNELGF